MSKFTNGYQKIISLIVGLMFFAGGLLFFFKYDPAAYDKQTTGTIVEINEYYDNAGEDNTLMHEVFISYKVGNKKYEHIPYFEYNSKMKEGDRVSFYYMSEDPSQIAGSNKESTPYIGLVFAIIGLGLIVVDVVKMTRKAS